MNEGVCVVPDCRKALGGHELEYHLDLCHECARAMRSNEEDGWRDRMCPECQMDGGR